MGKQITIKAGVEHSKGRVYFDSTVGLNTKFMFKYSHEILVNITTDKGQRVVISTNGLKIVTALIEGQVVSKSS